MASVTLNPKVLADPRFAALMERLGASRAEAWGLVSLLWLATRSAKLEAVTTPELVRLLPFFAGRTTEALIGGLLSAGFLTGAQGAYHIVDNAGHNERSQRRQERAAKAGLASAAKRAKKKRTRTAPKVAVVVAPAAAPEQPKAEMPISLRAWLSYAAAYERRWMVAPVSNATVRGQMAAIVKRIGKDAVGVMAFYVSHNDKFYILKQHPVGLALKDCESLATQYKTQRPVTSYDVAQAERVNAQYQQLEDIRAGKI